MLIETGYSREHRLTKGKHLPRVSLNVFFRKFSDRFCTSTTTNLGTAVSLKLDLKQTRLNEPTGLATLSTSQIFYSCFKHSRKKIFAFGSANNFRNVFKIHYKPRLYLLELQLVKEVWIFSVTTYSFSTCRYRVFNHFAILLQPFRALEKEDFPNLYQPISLRKLSKALWLSLTGQLCILSIFAILSAGTQRHFTCRISS